MRSVGREGEVPAALEAETVERLLTRSLGSNAIVVILPIQDVLATDDGLRPEAPADERINVPSTDSLVNWRYRCPLSVEAFGPWLESREEIRRNLAERRARPLAG